MKIAFIGGGNMGAAMVTGILDNGVMPARNICMSDIDVAKLEEFGKRGVVITNDNQEAADFADYIFLAVKPQQYEEAFLAFDKTEGKVVITMAPGVSIDDISKRLGGVKVIRIMPNTPAKVREGATAMCCGEGISEYECKFVKELLASFGEVYCIEESKMDDIVALLGSSPAYAYMLVEAMAEHAAKCGIDYDLAVEIAAQVMKGSSKMILETKKSPQALREEVCSQGGTTIKAVEALQKAKFAETIGKAMDACTARAKELAKKG